MKPNWPTGLVIEAENVAEAYVATLRILSRDGEVLEGQESKSVGSKRRSKEILDYLLQIQYPRQRLISRPINLPGAVARFVWMMGANSRLKDIEFYWGQRVTTFSDDGIIVPGSSYGERMLHSRPGVNQIEGVISRLRNDPSTRRAAVSIYQAEDAIRESADIPCAFGIFYHIRNGALHASVVMRSSNAFTLLQYNLFEFSLLAEAVAAELEVPLGGMSYFALSMHLYETDWLKAEEIVNDRVVHEAISFPEMPHNPSPVSQIKDLVKLEADARHAAAGFKVDNFSEWVDRASEKLNTYWRQFYYLLLLHMANKHQLAFATDLLATIIEDPWKKYLPPDLFSLGKPAESTNLLGERRSIIQIEAPAADLSRRRLASLEAICEKIPAALGGQVVSLDEYRTMRDKFVGPLGEPLTMAAKDIAPEVTQKEVEDALKEIRTASGSKPKA